MNFSVSSIDKRNDYQIIVLQFVDVPDLKDIEVSIIASNDFEVVVGAKTDIPWFLAKKAWSDFNRSKVFFSLQRNALKDLNFKHVVKRVRDERDRRYKTYLNLMDDVKVDYSLLEGEHIIDNGGKIILDLIKKDRKNKVDAYGYKKVYLFQDTYGNYFSLSVRSDETTHKLEENTKFRICASLTGHYVMGNKRINSIRTWSASAIKVLE